LKVRIIKVASRFAIAEPAIEPEENAEN
jgi:hypothetical protein